VLDTAPLHRSRFSVRPQKRTSDSAEVRKVARGVATASPPCGETNVSRGAAATNVLRDQSAAAKGNNSASGTVA
jgi:hypothetical protein